MKKHILLTAFLSAMMFGTLQAQQFSYTPISPFFGGTNAFNYQQIISSATLQNSTTDPNILGSDPRTELEQFADNVNAQVLSQLSRSLTATQVDALNFDEPGTFTAGEFAIEIFESVEGLVINILDTTTGEESQIVVPN